MFRGIADTAGIWLLYIVLKTNDILYGILFVRLFYIGHIFFCFARERRRGELLTLKTCLCSIHTILS